MKLTGKALEDFTCWFNIYSQSEHKHEWLDYDLYLDEVYLPTTLLNALIIEWFDSVGIYIFTDMTNVSDRFIFHVNNEFNEVEYNSRQQATEESILKANEIYNQKQE